MAFNPEHLITRQPIFDRNREMAFIRLTAQSNDYDIVMPFMFRLANIQDPHAIYFVPIAWVHDEILLKKLAKNMVLVTPIEALAEPIVERARESDFRIAALMEQGNAREAGSDFTIIPLSADATPSPDTIYTGVDTTDDEARAKASLAMYYSGQLLSSHAVPVPGSKRINPSHALILELMSAVQQEVEPKTIETLFKRDITLSFKLLRYINSPWFGLVSQVESVRHALSVIGYQQLLKWLTLLAITAGQEPSPLLTQTSMVRAKLMELAGAKLLDKREADNLFVTGMLSLLDRIIGVPMEEILKYVNLQPTIVEALLNNEGRYARFLQLALVCEGEALPAEMELDDIDARNVNIAHLEAIEWAAQAARNV
jgi:EAL and modified HD-GYP domain-containing signal transduction protein